MRKFLLSMALLLCSIGAMAQVYQQSDKIYTAAELNEMTEATYIAVKNVSGTNSRYLAANENVEEFSNNVVLVWEPAETGVKGTYHLRRLSAGENGYIQAAASGAVTLGSKTTAQNFVAEERTAISESGFNSAGALVRFIQQNANTWLNCQNATATPVLGNTGQGGWTMHNVYAVEEKPAVNVTYNYLHNGEIKKTVTVEQAIGSAYALPVDIPYVTETFTEGTVTEETTIEVACELESTPFEAAASYGEIEKWYYMQIRDDSFTYLQYDNTKQYIPASQSSEPTSSKNTYAWAFVGDPFNGFQIVNRAAGETMVLSAPSTPTGDKNAAELARMVQKENAAGNTAWVITPATHPNAVANTFYVQHPTATAYAFNRQAYEDAQTLCYWSNRDTGSALKVIECEISTLGDDLATLVAQAEALLEQIEIGDGVGKYSSSYENYATVYAEIVDYSKNIPATATDEEIQEKITTLNAIINSFSLNMPEKGKYYRLYCEAGDLYLSSDISNDRLEMQEKNPTSASQVFLCVENGENLTLLSYAKGQAINAYNLDAIGTMSTVKFSATYNGVLSQYNIKINDTRYIYGQGNTQNNHIDSGAGNPNINGYNWTIEEVTELPVTVSAAGYATLYAPVALTVPSGVKAYTAAINGEWATLTEVNGVIPANTGVVLEGEGNYSFAIAEDAQSIEGNALRGSVATTYYTEAGTYYALAMVDDVVGFYKDEFNNNRFQNNSHKAYLYVAPEAAANVACYSFRFDGTTGIENVEGQSEGTVVYDLMGRRVENPTRGIYVINGKKVLVK